MSFNIPEESRNDFQFKQGQSLTVKTRINEEEIRGTYSICSSPLDNELRVAIKKRNDGALSVLINERLKPGDVLDVTSPIGKFYTELNPANKKNYLAIAIDPGIIPIISIVKTTLLTEKGSSFTLIFESPDHRSMIFFEELQALKNKFLTRLQIIYILASQKPESSLFSGHLNVEKCEHLSKRLINLTGFDEFFICCTEETEAAIRQWLIEKGINHYKIHHDISVKPENKANNLNLAPKKTSEGQKSKVTIIVDGRTIEFELGFDEEPILDAALNYGLVVPYACKAGICNTCKAKLLEGKVEMKATYALDDEEIEQGFILTCQSHPLTETIVVNYDENL